MMSVFQILAADGAAQTGAGEAVAAQQLQEKAAELAQEALDHAGVTQTRSAIDAYFEQLPVRALSLGIRVLIALVILWVGSRVIRFLLKLVKKAMNKAGAETGVTQFVQSFLKAVLYVVLLLLIAAEFGVDTASIIAIVGSAGIAIGLALQGSLSNLAGGVLILLMKPFTVGDYISESATGKEGTVSDIQIFYTKLVTFDNKIVVLPNGALAGATITNVTKSPVRRQDIRVSVSYSADLSVAKQALTQMLEEDPSVLKEREHRVVVEELGDSGVHLIVRFWCNSGDYWDARFRITESCKTVLDRAGVEIPFPQVDVHMK